MKPLVNIRTNCIVLNPEKKICFYDEYLNIAGDVKRSDDKKINDGQVNSTVKYFFSMLDILLSEKLYLPCGKGNALLSRLLAAYYR